MGTMATPGSSHTLCKVRRRQAQAERLRWLDSKQTARVKAMIVFEETASWGGGRLSSATKA